eukprot:284253-Prorocentrum_lima.AAC.1
MLLSFQSTAHHAIKTRGIQTAEGNHTANRQRGHYGRLLVPCRLVCGLRCIGLSLFASWGPISAV